VKLGVTVTQLDEASLIARAAELASRRRSERVLRISTDEVGDGERELGVATGDLRQPDER
jgi:hypothetical protein